MMRGRVGTRTYTVDIFYHSVFHFDVQGAHFLDGKPARYNVRRLIRSNTSVMGIAHI